MAKKRSDLQGIRGIAIVAVLLFHYFPKIFPNGYIGVDQWVLCVCSLSSFEILLWRSGRVTYVWNRCVKLRTSTQLLSKVVPKRAGFTFLLFLTLTFLTRISYTFFQLAKRRERAVGNLSILLSVWLPAYRFRPAFLLSPVLKSQMAIICIRKCCVEERVSAAYTRHEFLVPIRGERARSSAIGGGVACRMHSNSRSLVWIRPAKPSFPLKSVKNPWLIHRLLITSFIVMPNTQMASKLLQLSAIVKMVFIIHISHAFGKYKRKLIE